MTTLGLVTVGQAPRSDVTPDIEAGLPAELDVVEGGALDEFDSADDIESEAGPEGDEPVFVTRLNDGSSVTIARNTAHDLLIERTQQLLDETDATAIGILCTGRFPDFDVSVPVLEPSELLHAWIGGITDGGETIGIVMPKPEQLEQTLDKWTSDEIQLETVAGSPYAENDEIEAAAAELGTTPDLVVLDCIGYNHEMKETVRNRTDAGVLLARSVLAKTATEVL